MSASLITGPIQDWIDDTFDLLSVGNIVFVDTQSRHAGSAGPTVVGYEEFTGDGSSIVLSTPFHQFAQYSLPPSEIQYFPLAAAAVDPSGNIGLFYNVSRINSSGQDVFLATIDEANHSSTVQITSILYPNTLLAFDPFVISSLFGLPLATDLATILPVWNSDTSTFSAITRGPSFGAPVAPPTSVPNLTDAPAVAVTTGSALSSYLTAVTNGGAVTVSSGGASSFVVETASGRISRVEIGQLPNGDIVLVTTENNNVTLRTFDPESGGLKHFDTVYDFQDTDTFSSVVGELKIVGDAILVAVSGQTSTAADIWSGFFSSDIPFFDSFRYNADLVKTGMATTATSAHDAFPDANVSSAQPAEGATTYDLRSFSVIDARHTMFAVDHVDPTANTSQILFVALDLGTIVTLAGSGGLTNQSVQAVSGTVDAADAGTTVTILDGSTTIGTAIAGLSGSWSASVTLSGDGIHVLTATDTAGTVPSNPVAYTLDTTLPTVSITTAGGPTSDASQTVSGTVDVADANSIVTISDGVSVLGTAVVQGDGSWSTSITLSGAGAHEVMAQDTDAAGNIGISNTVTFTLVTTAPSAYSDFYITQAASPLAIVAATGVLANDSDPNGLSLTIVPGADVLHGALTLNADGSFNYTPNSGFVGNDSFTYTASDGVIESDLTTVNIVVGATNALEKPEQQLGELYVGYYNRAPDPGGLNFWISTFTTPPAETNPFYQNLPRAADSFADPGQAETIALYPFLADPAGANYDDVVHFVQDAYQNLFNRATDPVGEGFWSTAIAKSLGIAVPFFDIPVIDGTAPLSASAALIAFIFGALGTDAQTVANKVTAGLYYKHYLEDTGVGATAESAHAAFDGVTFDPATVLTSEAATNAFVQSALHDAAAPLAAQGIVGDAQHPLAGW